MRRVGMVVTATLCLLLVSVLPVSVNAQPQAQSQPTGPDAPAFRHVMLELDAAPATQVYAAVQAAAVAQADLVAATRAQLATVEAQQATLLAALDEVDAQVLYRVQRVYNGVAVRVPTADVARLAALPHVRAVHALVPKAPTNTVSVPFIGAHALWTGASGQTLTGAGLTIAVIDTGVDYLHAAFGGSRRYDENDPTTIGDVPDFPGFKIIDGYDFAGDAYDADPDNVTYNPVPTPDPDPTDCYNHGTHVAATAAGMGVLKDEDGGFGGTYTGPYDASVQSRTFLIGPGVAPEATIIALKVFGCQGSSELTELAIEWAVDPNGDGDFSDKVDVINMSLGSTYGSMYDPSSVASDNAALAGVVVVASAGNSGNVYFATGSPAVADRAISVAAIRNHLDMLGTPTAAPVATSVFTSRGPRRNDSVLKPDIAAPGQAINSAILGAPGWKSASYSGTSMAAPHVAGAMTLLRQQFPDWSVEELKALVMNTAAFALDDDAILPSPVRVGAGIIDLEQALEAQVLAMDARVNGRVSISFPPADVLDTYTDTLGLRVQNLRAVTQTYAMLYVPIVDLPGVGVAPVTPLVTVPAGGSAVTQLQLTAQASAMGHPRPADVNVTSGYPRHWLDEETGRLELWPIGPNYTAAMYTTLPIDGSPAAAQGEVRFTYAPHTQALVYEVEVDDANAAEFTVIELHTRTAAGDPDDLVATLPPARRTPGGSQATGIATLDATVARQMANDQLIVRLVRPGTQPMELIGAAEADARMIQVPVFATARRVADVHTASAGLDVDPVTGHVTGTISLAGVPRAASSEADAGPALLSLFERRYTSPNSTATPPFDRADALLDHADLRYIGISSDLYQDLGGPIENRRLYFGLVSHAVWGTPNEVELNIFIDVNEDRVDDYRLFNADALGYNSDRLTSDALVAVVENLATGAFFEFEPLNGQTALNGDTAPYRTNVMILPVKAGDIGLDDSNTSFNYRVETYSVEREEAVEVTPTLRYDIRASALNLLGSGAHGPSFVAAPGETITLPVNEDLFRQKPVAELLLIHHHNALTDLAGTNRVELVSLFIPLPEAVYLPVLPGVGD